MPNPILPAWEYIPDGEPRVFGDRVYLYGSHDRAAQSDFCDYKLKVWSAPLDDLNNWVCHGHSFHTRDDRDHKSDTEGMTDRKLFAPDVIEKDGRYYLYAYIVGSKGVVGVSDKPEGPFKLLSQYKYDPEDAGDDGIYNDAGVLVDDEDIYKQIMLYSLHGQSKDALAKTKLGAWEYDIKGTYYKCNMTDIMASIGLVQLKRYPGLLKRRRDIIERYTQGIAADDVDIMKHFTDEYTSSGHLYLVRLLGKDVKERNELITRLAEAGVATNVHFKPLPMHTAYKNMGFDIKDFPHSYNMYRNEITLPLHTCLTDEQVEYVIEQFNRMK